MADKDIKLVIRAKNEASKTLDSVNSALKELSDSQAQAAVSAAKADSTFGALGAEVDRLSKELAKLNALKVIAGSLDKAAQSVSTMQNETKRVAGDFAALAREADNAKQATDRLRGQAVALGEAYRVQKDAVRAAKLEQREANKELTRSEGALKRLSAQLDKQGRVSAFAANTKGSAKASAEVFMQGDVGNAKGKVDATTTAFKQQEVALGSLKTGLADVNKHIGVAAANHTKLAQAAQDTATNLSQSKSILAGARSELSQVQGAAASAAQAVGGFTLNQKQLEQQTEATARQLRESADLMKALGRFSTGGGGFASPKAAADIRRQREEMEGLKSTWTLLQGEAAQLAQGMRNTVQPTEAQATAFRNATAAAKQAKLEYQAQQQALARLTGSTQGTFAALSQIDGGLRKISASARQNAQEIGQSVNKLNGIRDIFGAFYGESRKAMSALQRVRGEVLSLATAYVGLYATIQNIGGVITAYQSLEAAQNRLGAVFGQDQKRVGQELDWLERQASRLGISFQVLADEYGKFSVAADAANFSQQNTRDIFLSVAEAARVNKLNVEQTSGVFLALQQMISKGKVSSEELRRQLGDRLTGAFNIFADAIGVTTQELDEMLQKGEVFATEQTLLKFADQLNKRFGPQLAASLQSTTAEIGRFQNSIFQAQLTVARGGFIEAMTEALRELNAWFASREGQEFFLDLGSALGSFVKVLAKIPQHFGLIVDAIQAVITLKFGVWLAGASNSAKAFRSALTATVASIRAVPTAAAAAGTSIVGFRAQLMTMGGALTAARAGLTALRAAMAALGGVGIGIVLFAVTEVLSRWLTSTNDVTKALEAHNRVMQQVRGAYDDAKGKVKDWAKEVKNLTLLEAVKNVQELQTAFKDMREEGRVSGSDFGLGHLQGSARKQAEALRDLQNDFIELGGNVDEYRKKVEEIGNATDDTAVKEYATALLEAANAAREQGDAVREAELVVKILAGTATEAEQAELLLKDAVDETRESFDSALPSVEEYSDAIEGLKEKIPELATELKKLKDLTEIEEDFDKALNSARTIGNANQAFTLREQAREAVFSEADRSVFKEIAANTKVSQEMFGFIHKQESFRANAYDDGYGNATIGFGSTRVNGRAVQMGDTITRGDAMKQAVADMARIVAQIEAMVKVPLSDSQLNVLVSYAYNAGIGSLKRDGILQPLNRGDYEGAANAIHNGVDTSGGVFSKGLRNRRVEEAAMFRSGNDDPEVLAAKVEQEEKITEEKVKQNEATAQSISDTEFEIKQGEMIAAGKGREAAIEAAIREAKKENKNISAEQLEQIRETTGALYDQKHATDEIEMAEKRVTDLKSHQQELMNQITFLQEQGEGGKAELLKTQLAGVNAELLTAVQRAIQLYQTLGGPGADLAIAKLNGVAMETQTIGQKSLITGQQINQMLASGITNAFDQFAQAIANGEDAVEAMKNAFLQFAADFLRQIAQMIIQQAILNALGGGSGGGGGVGGFISSLVGGLFHAGGIAGQAGPSRSISPAWFQNAVRYHEGGIAGLKAGEVPAILKRGEEILTEDNPRHIANAGEGGGSGSTKIINAFDSASFLSESLNSKVGERAILNFVRANSGAFKAALG